MFVRSATGADAPGPGQPLPAPARWHLRTQVSRKTLFDLVHDTLPPGALPRTVLSDDGGPLSQADADQATHWPASTGSGVMPQAYLDPNAATVPVSLNPATLWNDGDTTPDIPEPWRPITITLAHTALTPQPQFPAPPLSALPQHPLHGAAKRAGWMLSGVALTFLFGAAAFGGGPMIRAVRSVLARPQAQAATIDAAPTILPAVTPAAHPAAEPVGRVVVAAAVEPARAPWPGADAPRAANRAGEVAESDSPKADSSGAGRDRDRRGAGIPARGARRPRLDRRAARASAPSGADSVLGGGDTVMPLEFATPVSRSAAARQAPPPIAKTAALRTFRLIDVENPFGGR